MSDSLKLTSEMILEKKFPKDLRGYDAYEVDLFLDQIAKDYQAVEAYLAKNDTYVSNLQERIETLESTNEKLTRENIKLREEFQKQEVELAAMNNKYGGIKEGDKPTTENLRLYKRIADLEIFLKAKGFSEAQLKEFLRKD